MPTLKNASATPNPEWYDPNVEWRPMWNPKRTVLTLTGGRNGSKRGIITLAPHADRDVWILGARPSGEEMRTVEIYTNELLFIFGVDTSVMKVMRSLDQKLARRIDAEYAIPWKGAVTGPKKRRLIAIPAPAVGKAEVGWRKDALSLLVTSDIQEEIAEFDRRVRRYRS